MINVQLWFIKIFMISAAVIMANGQPVWAASTDEARSWFEAGNTAYREGRYQAAAELYQNIYQSGWLSADMLFNMGNTQYRLGEPGTAILWYERARFVSPRDSDIRFNLKYVRQKEQSQTIFNQEAGIVEWVWHHLLDDMAVNELMIIAVIWFVFVAVIGLAAILFPQLNRVWRLSGVLCLGLGLVTVGAIGWKVTVYGPLAVVTADVESTFEPRPAATVHFSLNSGSHVFILKHESDWVKIRRPDGKVGWVPSKHVGRIIPQSMSKTTGA
jgi:hypothetical protein